jgi:heat-inducible transcriptional repressor
MAEELSGRTKQILEAIIEDYIATAEPVGSRAVARRHGLSISPATVRNVMADLEEMGFLVSPHTSAGRIPTDKAYRLYVNALLGASRLDLAGQERLLEKYRIRGGNVGEILTEASRLLSSMSHHTGIVLAPRFGEFILRHLEFVKLGGSRVLAILVSEDGMVQNKIVEADEELPAEDLVRMSNFLNGLLRGLSVAEVKDRLVREMRDEKVMYDRLLAKALLLSEETVSNDRVEVIIEGQANILDQPEFAEVGKMREIFRAFEEKSQILDILNRSLSAEGVQIFIGAETHLTQMEGMSVITSTYMSGHRRLGVLGVIGPTRMGYANVIPIVDYTAKLVTKLLENQ